MNSRQPCSRPHEADTGWPQVTPTAQEVHVFPLGHSNYNRIGVPRSQKNLNKQFTGAVRCARGPEQKRPTVCSPAVNCGSCRDTRVTYRNCTERWLSEDGSRGSLMVGGSTNFRLHQVHLGPFAAPPSPQRGSHAGLVHAEVVLQKSHPRNGTEMTAFTHTTAWEAQLGNYWDN